ncbi:NADH dehydrogenase [ubiquinone] 1 beta subcomplex subunit 2, mitochondrial-like [Daktulosphaira vitifoliae]|uniref:NADH dehydrogenase [ubiquinone] 1 beta subcomplex subunit 2, mitochondrial-like n=1 Tax=Daktulosphaira vitifoliae TaxID=58002 RepID=UPI0021AAE7B8|nr:NADH dehydrogenase [ubiquinone] 1 beta subcomplex subunit 2, mitochondrial-like [Daktulosphaira vitifoliae]
MSGLNMLKRNILKNVKLFNQSRLLHLTPRTAAPWKTVAKREGLNGDHILDLHYDFHYRGIVEFDDWDKKKNLIADVCMGIVLAFVLYKCYSEPEHLLGDFEYPDASKWTDEELGIPPVD